MKSSPQLPPKLFHRFFRWYCHPRLLDHIEGDLLEEYTMRLERDGKRKADIKFIIDVILLFRRRIVRPITSKATITPYGMYKSYFKIGWRNLIRNKGYSFINIGGLAVSMTVAMLIGLWIWDELLFNTNHENYNTIAQVYRAESWPEEKIASTAQTTGLGTLLQTEYATHFKHVVMVRARTEERVVAVGEKKFTQDGYFMQDGGPQMFTLNMIYGTRDGLKDISSIMLSSSLAKKLFGDADPVGEVVTMDARWELKVTGVYEDLPKNSTFHDASYLAPLDRYLDGWAGLDAWDNYHMYVYVQLNPGEDFKKVSSIIKECTRPHAGEDMAEVKQEVFLHPMSDWHLNSEYENGAFITSKKMMTVWYYGAIGVFVLLLACINFMNLSTARSEKRAKEVGIRKSIGSVRSQLVQQFYGESFFISAISFVFALTLVQLALPWLNTVADKSISIPWSLSYFWLACLSFVILTALLAGSYPALYLSSFKPVSVLKGTFMTGRSATLPRKFLVVAQFTVSVILTIGTIIVHQQIQFTKSRPVGYNRKGLIGLRATSPEFRGKYDAMRNKLIQTGEVEEIAESNYGITDTRGWNGGFAWQGHEFEPSFNTIYVTPEYGKTIGWEFVDGRDFSREMASDSNAIVINESALAILGIENPVGEILTWNPGWQERGAYRIIGVVKDMVKGSPFEPTNPSIIFPGTWHMSWLYIRIKPSSSPHIALPKIKSVLAEIAPGAPFDYTFASDDYAAKFQAEERISKFATIFSLMAIGISCLGLFGLSAYTIERRTKEIGIRKVLGASVANLWQMLSRDFVVLVVIACVIAIPAALYFMNNWLLQYEYRMSLSWSVFVLTSLGAVAIAMLTVSFQAIKVGMLNPVESLRSE